jgi:hypothetical protein
VGQQRRSVIAPFFIKLHCILPFLGKIHNNLAHTFSSNGIKTVIKLQQEVNINFVVVLFTFGLYPFIFLPIPKVRFSVLPAAFINIQITVNCPVI